MRRAFKVSLQQLAIVIPRLDRGTQYSRRLLFALVARCVSFGLIFALGPGSRDGLSVHTVRDDSWGETGRPCRETSPLRGRANERSE